MKHIDQNNTISKDKLFVFEFILLLVAWLCILFYLNKFLPVFIDSDSSSELLLSKILCDEHKLMTDSWIYSTELRVLNTQIVFAFFFIFFKEWHTVRMLSIVIFHVVLFLSVVFLCKQIQPNNNHYPLICFIMLLPFTRWYLRSIICESYYIPHVTINFVILGLFYCYVFRNHDKTYNIIILLISSLLSFVSGLGGIRQMVITFSPLLITSVVFFLLGMFYKENKRAKVNMYQSQVIFSLIMFIANSLGYLVNSKFLSQKYTFHLWQEISFTTFNRDTVIRIFKDFLFYFGYSDYNVGVISIFENILSIILLIALILFIAYGFKKESTLEYKFIVYFFLANVFVFISIYAFTSMHYSFRYIIPSLITSYIIGYLFLFEVKCDIFSKITKTFIVCILVILFSFRSALYLENEYNTYSSIVARQDLLKVVDYLFESDYDSGFATFWNSNVVVELTDGKETMYTWLPSGDDGSFNQKDPRLLYEWLIPSRNCDNPPTGKVFVLYRDIEIPNCDWKDKLKNEDIIFKTPSYIVYGYEDYSTMISTYGFR